MKNIEEKQNEIDQLEKDNNEKRLALKKFEIEDVELQTNIVELSKERDHVREKLSKVKEINKDLVYSKNKLERDIQDKNNAISKLINRLANVEIKYNSFTPYVND